MSHEHESERTSYKPNHPTQGLQEMTLDLSTYSVDALAELQTRIEEEKTKRERKVPFEVSTHTGLRTGEPDRLVIQPTTQNISDNLYHRLTAEAKLRAAGGGSHEWHADHPMYYLHRDVTGDVFTSEEGVSSTQGAIYFKTSNQALSAYATLTPDEQAAIFGFGEG